MLKLRNCFWDLFLCILLYLCVAIIAKVNLSVGRYSRPCADEFCKTLCPAVSEMCAELARGGFQGLSAPLIDHCSHQLDDGVGARASVTKRDEGFWSSIEHPWLLLTGFLCTVLLIQLILGIVKKRDALKAEKIGRRESIRSTQEQVMSRVRDTENLARETLGKLAAVEHRKENSGEGSGELNSV